MAHKSYKLVQNQRQTEKERNKNIQHTTQEEELVGGGRPLLPEIFGQPTPIGAKSPIFNRYSPVAPQP